MNPISILTSNGFIKLHSCGCSGGESTWKANSRPNVIRLRNTSKIVEVREKNRAGKILKSFSWDNLTEAIKYVQEN